MTIKDVAVVILNKPTKDAILGITLSDGGELLKPGMSKASWAEDTSPPIVTGVTPGYIAHQSGAIIIGQQLLEVCPSLPARLPSTTL